jgi:hypothetical protein
VKQSFAGPQPGEAIHLWFASRTAAVIRAQNRAQNRA